MAKKKVEEKEPEWPEEGFYYHYKHDPKGDINNYAYQVLGVSRNTETRELGVDYLPLYEREGVSPNERCWRPLKMFAEKVKSNGQMVPRFAKITDQSAIKSIIWLRNKMFDKAKGITLPPSRPD